MPRPYSPLLLREAARVAWARVPHGPAASLPLLVPRQPSGALLSQQRCALLRLRRADAAREQADAARDLALRHTRALQRSLKSGRVRGWGVLERLVNAGEANEYHFSLLLRDGCTTVEDVGRLSALMDEVKLRPNRVLATGLHAAWVRHGRYSLAAEVLVSARKVGVLTAPHVSTIISRTLEQLVRRHKLLNPAPPAAGDEDEDGVEVAARRPLGGAECWSAYLAVLLRSGGGTLEVRGVLCAYKEPPPPPPPPLHTHTQPMVAVLYLPLPPVLHLCFVCSGRLPALHRRLTSASR
jgi:hypothetical protein